MITSESSRKSSRIFQPISAVGFPIVTWAKCPHSYKLSSKLRIKTHQLPSFVIHSLNFFSPATQKIILRKSLFKPSYNSIKPNWESTIHIPNEHQYHGTPINLLRSQFILPSMRLCLSGKVLLWQETGVELLMRVGGKGERCSGGKMLLSYV